MIDTLADVLTDPAGRAGLQPTAGRRGPLVTPDPESIVGATPDAPPPVAAQAGDAIGTFVSMDAVAIAVGIVVVLTIVAVVTWILRGRGPPEGVRFRKVLSGADSVAVLMHPNPDPDAMASAVAVAHLADHFGTDSTIQFAGAIQHPENRAFQTVLDLDLDRIETRHDLAAEDVILVDHNEPRGFQGAAGIEPLAVVDHHPGEGTGSAFTDVRTGYGACATILAEYYMDLDATVIDSEDEEEDGDDLVLPSDVATGLVYGIMADTGDLTKGTSPAEFRACQYLHDGLDESLLDRIATPPVDSETLDVKARAIEHRQVRPPYAIANVGEVANVDAIPQAADELVALDSVMAVVVYGRKDGTLHLSGRSRDDRVHMGRVLEAATEEIPMASAGGHARMGGGQLSIAHMEGIGPSGGIDTLEFESRLFAAMRGEI